MSVLWSAELVRQPYDWRKPNRFAHPADWRPRQMSKVVFAAYGAPDGECDHELCALKPVTNMVDGIKLEVIVQSFSRKLQKHNS